MPLDFDYAAARQAGYSDDDILNGLQQHGKIDFDLNAARKAGYSSSEILDTLNAPVPQKPDTGDFMRGAKETFQQLPQLGYGLMAGAGAALESAVGEGGIATGIKKAGVKGYQEWGDKIAKDAKESDSFSYSAHKVGEGDFGAMVDWLQHAFGYAGGQGIQMLASAGLGSVVGKAGLRAVAEKVASGMVEKEAARLAAQEGATLTADQIAKTATANVAAKLGQTAAIGAQAFGQEGGEIFGDLSTKSAQENRPLSGGELAKAFGATLAAGGLEFIGDKVGLDIMLGKSALMKPAANMAGIGGRTARGAIAAAGAAPIEGATEYGQTLLEEAGKGNDPFSDESLRQARDAAAIGAVGGVTMGGVGGMFHGAHQQTSQTESMPQGGPQQSPLQIANNPDPLVAFPDGTVGRRADIDSYINSLPEEQRIPARAKLLGYGEQPATVQDIGDAASVDEAISAANSAINAPPDHVGTTEDFNAFLRRAAEAGALEALDRQQSDVLTPEQMQEQDRIAETLYAAGQNSGSGDLIVPTEPATQSKQVIAPTMSLLDAQLAAQRKRANGELLTSIETALADMPLPEQNAPGLILPEQRQRQRRTIPMNDTLAGQGSDTAEQTAMQLAMQKAQERRNLVMTPVSERAQVQPQEAAQPAPAKSKWIMPEAKEVAVKEKPATAFSVGRLPNSAEAITVRDGSVFIGKYPAQNFETGEDVKVAQDATHAHIKDALIKAGAIGNGQRFFGLKASPVEQNRKLPLTPVSQRSSAIESQNINTMESANGQKTDTTRNLRMDQGEGGETSAKSQRTLDESLAQGDVRRGITGIAEGGQKTAGQVGQSASSSALRKTREETLSELEGMSNKQLRDMAQSDRRIYVQNAVADILETRNQTSRQKRSESARKIYAKARGINPEVDSMSAAIAKVGGVSTESAKGRLRLTPEELNAAGSGIRRIFTKSGRLMDEMGALMAEMGYVQTDENGKHDTRDFEDKLAEAANGATILTPQGMMARAQKEYEAALQEFEASSPEEYDAIERYADDMPNYTSEDVDAPLENIVSLADGLRAMGFTEQEINDELGRQGTENSAGEGNHAGAESTTTESRAGNAASDFSLQPESEAEANARLNKLQEQTRLKEIELKKLEEKEKQERIQKEIDSRQQASAENFQLGQSAEDGLSGQKNLIEQKRDEYTQDLFGEPVSVASREYFGKVQQPPTNRHDNMDAADTVPVGSRFATHTKIVAENQRTLGAKTVTSATDAAQALAYLGRGAVERLDALVTDKNGKPLAIVGAFKGALTQASVYPATIAGEAFRVKGAANIWFVHNHPSGNPELSSADRDLYTGLSNIFKGSNIEPRGMMAIAGGVDHVHSWSFTNGREDQSGETAVPTENVTVPSIERQYAEHGKMAPAISSPAAAKGAAKEIANGESGIILLDVRHRPVGFVPVDIAQPLRENGRMDALHRALSIANPAASMIVNNGGLDDNGIRNLAGFLNSLDTKVLDVFDMTSPPVIESWAESRKNFKDHTFQSVSSSKAPGLSAATITKAITNLRAKWLGFTRINTIQSVSDLPADIADRVKPDAQTEGFYDPQTKSVYLIADNIASTERAAWIAAHEVIGHGGLRMLKDKSVNEALNLAGQNQYIRDLAAAIKLDRGDISQQVAIEEAIAETAAAIETGDFQGLKNRYGVDAPKNIKVQQGLISRVIEAVRRFLASVMGKPVAEVSDADVRKLIYAQREAVSTEQAGRQNVDQGNMVLASKKTDQINTAAFKKWFGDSKVVDADGKPLVVYHGTNTSFNIFDPILTRDIGVHFGTANQASRFGNQVMPVFLKIKNPLRVEDRFSRQGQLAGFEEDIHYDTDITSEESDQLLGLAHEVDRKWDDDRDVDNTNIPEAKEFWSLTKKILERSGFDGLVYKNKVEGAGDSYVVFRPEQIKSATSNSGSFDANNPSILQSRAPTKEHIPQWAKDLPADVQAALRKSGAIYEEKTAKQKLIELKTGALKKLQYGVLDQFAPIKDKVGKTEYMLARMAKAADGTLEAAMLYGRPYLDKDGAPLVDTTKKGFVETMQALNGEHDRFFSWLAGRRASELKKQGRENLFTDDDISTLSALNQGKMKDGSSREAAYLRAQKDIAELNKSVLDIAERSGIIDTESRKVWASDFYVPFYRVMEEGVTGPSIKSGLVNQKTIKKLKGGTNNLGDLTQNMLMNWSTLLTASAKNRAASATLTKASNMGAATEADETTIRQMGKSASTKAVSFMDGGKNRWFVIEDDHLLAAVSALEFNGYNNNAMKVMSKFKNYLTTAVTASPMLKVRNLIRDSITTIGVSDAEFNPIANVKKGFSLLGDKQFKADMIAGGGVFRFGTLMEGQRGEHVKNLTDAGVKDETILDTKEKMQAFMRNLWGKYQELGDLSENVNRAALYSKLRNEGKSHLEASFEARDLMDFGLSGAWAGVRALNQILPFFNARLQGLYKLGRAYNDDPKRLGYVVGAVALASVALMLAFKDDEDFKKRSDSDRNNYWWFKVGDIAYRIPKPFEIGAMGSAIEHFTALFFDSDNTNVKRFANQLGDIVNSQLSMNPIPQLFRPIIDIYANKDSFTGRPIESMAMQNLKPEDRYTYNTSELARMLSKSGVMIDPLSLVAGTGVKQLSPVQIDAMIKGYFSGLGVFATATVDSLLHHTVIDRGEALPMTLKDFAGSFAETLPSNSSRYVDMMYQAAQDIEQSYNSYKNAIKSGDINQARNILASEGDKIAKYHMVESLKRNESRITQQIQNSKTISGDDKFRRIRSLRQEQDRIARAYH